MFSESVLYCLQFFYEMSLFLRAVKMNIMALKCKNFQETEIVAVINKQATLKNSGKSGCINFK